MGSVPATARSYLICSTPRTGSYLLCDALAATGVAGRPTEYLMPSYRDHWAKQWGTTNYRDYHERVLVDGTTPNGVFGAKIHSGQFEDLLRRATGRPRVPLEERPAIVAGWFPQLRYIWLRRRDEVQQAVSWTKAVQTRLWWDADAPPAPMDAPKPDAFRFDYQFIERAMYALVDWDGVWRTYFDATNIVPLTVWYEDLVADRQHCIDRVLEYLDVRRVADQVDTDERFRRQSDDTSAIWASRFRLLHAAKRELTIASLAGLHTGETVYICNSDSASDLIPHDAVTIAVNGAQSPVPANYGLLTRAPAAVPKAGVVLSAGRSTVNHPYVVSVLLDHPTMTGESARRNRLAVGEDDTETGIAVALANHLGAQRIEVA